MNKRKILIKYGIVKTKLSSMTYFKITSNQVNGNNSVECYVSDIDNPELPTYLESMGSNSEFVINFMGKYNTIGIICNLFVEPNYRCNGIGSNLIASAINEFHTLNTDAVIVIPDIHNHNPHLHNGLEYWYEDRGFKVIGRINEIPLMIINMKDHRVELS